MMARVGGLSPEVAADAAFQRALIKAVEEVESKHGVFVDRVTLTWSRKIDGDGRGVECGVDRVYRG